MISLTCKGDFSKTRNHISNAKNSISLKDLEKYGARGVHALSGATPVDTGETANSWRYEINRSKDRAVITFLNDNINDGVPIAIILQYGHLTKNGSWVEGRDYINPAIQPVFDDMVDDLWKEATK
ncbi:MAG: HK97 gp10 family phage protein [Prevotellaceae bacterium]|nr:HK97 gp10 family phage protein [Candidatus Colivivens equi]